MLAYLLHKKGGGNGKKEAYEMKGFERFPQKYELK